MGTHARLPASGTKDWATCPGRQALEDLLPTDDAPGDAARLGTCAHALGERCLREGAEPAEFLGRLLEIVGEGTASEGVSMLRKGARVPTKPGRLVFEVDENMTEAVERLVDYVRDRCWELLPPAAGDPTPAEHVRLLVKTGLVRLETRVNPLVGRDDTGGTSDVVIDAWPYMLEVVDYKHGERVYVPVEENPQLRTYCAGALVDGVETSDDPDADPFQGIDYERVRYTIVQPRCREAPPGGVSWEELDTRELVEDWLLSYLKPAVRRVDEALSVAEAIGTTDEQDLLEVLHEGGFLSTGDDGSCCTYCPRRTRCPEAISRVQRLVQVDFQNEPAEIPTPPTWNPPELGKLLTWAPFVKKFFEAAEKEAEKVALAGIEVPGFKLVYSKSFRKWREDLDEAGVVREAVKYGVRAEDMYTSPSLITGPQAEKLIPKPDRKAFEEATMFKPQGRPQLALESDKRPAIGVGDVGGDFDGEDLDG